MIRWVAAFGTGGTTAQVRGDLTEAERSAKQALHIARDAGEPDAFMVYASQIGPVRQMQNRVGDVAALEQIVQANPLIRSWHAALAAATRSAVCVMIGVDGDALVANSPRGRLEAAQPSVGVDLASGAGA